MTEVIGLLARDLVFGLQRLARCLDLHQQSIVGIGCKLSGRHHAHEREQHGPTPDMGHQQAAAEGLGSGRCQHALPFRQPHEPRIPLLTVHSVGIEVSFAEPVGAHEGLGLAHGHLCLIGVGRLTKSQTPLDLADDALTLRTIQPLPALLNRNTLCHWHSLKTWCLF